MKTKTRIGAGLVATLIAIIAIFMVVQVFADASSMYIENVRKRPSGEQFEEYDISSGSDYPIWKYVYYADSTSPEKLYDKAIYCLKPEIGFGSATHENVGRQLYNDHFDMKDLTELEQKYVTMLGNLYGTTDSERNAIYNSLLWVIDNMYLPQQGTAEERATIRKLLFDAAKITPDAETKQYHITDNDVEVVQQIALWYFASEEALYHYNPNDADEAKQFPVLLFKEYLTESATDPEAQYIMGASIDPDPDRLEDMIKLYKYFVNSAGASAAYGNGDKREIDKPELAFTKPNVGSNTETVTIDGVDYYLAGPFKVKDDQNSSLPYSIDLAVSNESDEAISDFKIFTKTGSTYTEVDKVTDEDDNERYNINKTYIEKNTEDEGKEFYIAVPTTNTADTKIKLKVNYIFVNTKAELWTNSETCNDPTDPAQPLVIPEKELEEDEIEIEVTIDRPEFDLALRKFIIQINGEDIETSREPDVDVSKLDTEVDGKKVTTATYTHPKNPLKVKTDDIVTYTIRVYNEGEQDGYAKEITDYIPDGMEFLSENEINTQYKWELSGDGKKATTTYLAPDETDLTDTTNLIGKFDKATMTEPNYKEVQIAFKVTEPNSSARILRNIAEISDDCDKTGEDVEDRDSTPNSLEDNNELNKYKTDTIPEDNSSWIEDDDDYEPLILSEFDLALRKFITAINDDEVTDRVPEVTAKSLEKLADPEDKTTTAKYVHPKDPLLVRTGDLVTYTIRIYNEGETSGYAKEITDNIPEGLSFVPTNATNIEYGWKLSQDGTKITTDYLSRDKNPSKVIEAFNTETKVLDYEDVKVVFEVTEPNDSKRILVNVAEISDDEDSNGNEVDDRDSIPGNNIDDEDDIDKEYLRLEEKIFDLALRKFITAINDDKVTTRIPQPTEESLAKLASYEVTTAEYVHPKDPLLVKTGDLVTYTIRIFNEGDTAGYAEEIIDDVPEGLKFLPEHPVNIEYRWQEISEGKEIVTDYLSKEVDEENNLIRAFDKDDKVLDYKDVKVVFEVIEPNDSNKVLINVAEINDDADENGEEIGDRDSTPGNKKDNEDDIDKEYLRLEAEVFDLALRKFITKVNETEVTTRIPQPTEESLNKLATNEITTAEYVHPKDPVLVKTGDLVTYTIRVFNEGTIAGYAQEVTDDIPAGLKFVPDDPTNIEYRWQLSSDGKEIVTDYLSKEVDAENNLIKAFDKDEKVLDYKDVKIVFEVIEPNTSKRTLINIAEISKDLDENGEDVEDRDSTPGNKVEKEDDIDKEYLELEYFDLALRKFITGINGTTVTEREPKPTAESLDKLAAGTVQTATYVHPKDPMTVRKGDKVIYTIRVYNEGKNAGTATEITDYIPEGLEFIADSSINASYKWVLSEDGKTVTTDYLKDSKIKAFDTKTKTLDYKDVIIEFEVTEPNTSERILRNIAEIRDDSADDIDSTPNNVDIDNYNPPADNSEYQEDDDDYEQLKLQYFDLALRKFITKVNTKDVTTRYPKVSIGSDGKIVYTHTKEPVLVANDDIVIYTIRVYNEGKIAGYAKEVTDDIPSGLTYLPKHEINTKYGWLASEDGKTVKTDYLSKEKSDERNEDNLLKAFNKENGITENNPDYRDLQIAFRVTETNLASNRIIINTAEISDDSDENGYDVTDEDSIPGNNVPGEDDIDKEYLKVKYFDLSLLKWVSKAIVTENGETKVTETGHTGLENPEPTVKVDLYRKNIDNITVKFEYVIKITNEGEIEGYAKEVSDYIPEGLKFVKADNPDWEEKDGKIVTRKLENTLLKPNESATVTVILTWINDENNMGQKVNVAEISEDYNVHNSKDIDSTPNNKKQGEDDIDDAPVLLTVRTGIEPTYTVLIFACLTILATGMILIKKFVL